MARSLHVRLDSAAEAALEVIRGEGLNDSDAVRTALRETAARRRARSALVEEAARLAEDPGDRAEMAAIREHMSELVPAPQD
jgi:Arc/MetJ-type ribon-helix-helix transcriptional regulator